MSRIQNSFQVTGRLATDLEIVNPDSPNLVGRVNLGIENGYKDRDTGNWVEQTLWAEVTFFQSNHIERLQKYSGKGAEITVRGRIDKNVWESKIRTNGDGSPAMDSKLVLIATELRLHGRPKGQEGTAGQAAGAGYNSGDDDIP